MEKSDFKAIAKNSLLISWLEGMPAAIMLGIMDYYLIPFALFLNASNRQIGWIVSIPHLLASCAQLYAVNTIRFSGNRRNFLIVGTLFQAVILLPLGFLVWFSGPWRWAVLVLVVVFYRVSGNLVGTAWGSLVSDYFPPQRRGDYFGWRAQVTGAVGLLAVWIAGFFLTQMSAQHAALSFFILFMTASSARFLSANLMRKLVDVPNKDQKRHDFTFWMFLRRFRESNYVKFVFFVAGMTFATFLAAPYFAVYMLRSLHFNYLMYAAVQFASVVASLLAFPIWGRHGDVVGNAKILKITGAIIPIIPILWLFSKQCWVLVVIEAFSGFVWGGFNLCATNFIYDAVSPEKRVRCLGYFALMNGLAMSLGTFLGGMLVGHLPLLGGFRLLSLFLLSGILRAFAYGILSRYFREVRPEIRHTIPNAKLLFSVIGLNPLPEVLQEGIAFPFTISKKTFDAEWLTKQLENAQAQTHE